MDKDTLISEICQRVKEKLDHSESCSDDLCCPRILVLTDKHGDSCHELLENSVLCEHYQLDCALLQEYQCDLSEYEAVIAFTLSIEAMGKIAAGIYDSDYTRMFGQALLSGKKIYLPQEDVQLYQYCETAPPAYYQQLAAGLKLLQDSGIDIVPIKELPERILGAAAVTAAEPPAKAAGSYEPPPEALTRLEKHIITERDIMTVHMERATVVIVDKKAILTDLAKEFANKQQIEIRRRDRDAAGKDGGL